MTFGGYPGEMNLFGSVIDSMMNCLSGWPAVFAFGTTAVPRFGPTVPVVPAAASVWHVPQPAAPGEHGLARLRARRQRARRDCEPPLDALPLRRAGGGGVPAPGTPGAPDVFGGGVPIGGAAFGLLGLEPALERRRGENVDGRAHQRVAGAAQLRALGRVVAGPRRRDPQRRRDARDGVELDRELGDEEAVDHVKRVKLEHDRLAFGEVQLGARRRSCRPSCRRTRTRTAAR